MMLAAVTLLPALIGFAGNRIEVTRLPRRLFGFGASRLGLLLAVLFGQAVFILSGSSGLVGVIGRQQDLREATAPTRSRTGETQASRGAGLVPVEPRHPAPAVAASGWRLVLLVLAVPVLSLALGFGDTGNLNEDQTTAPRLRPAGRGLRPRLQRPDLVTVTGDTATNTPRSRAGDTLRAPRVSRVSDPIESPTISRSCRSTPTARRRTRRPRSSSIACATTSSRRPASPARVGGFNAASVDFADYIGDRLPILIGAVLVLSFFLLMVVFRSLLVPLKAVIMNLLSIGAAYGVVVAVFQWGWGASLIGVERGPDRGLGADDAVRHRLRSLDGLRGLPALTHEGGVRPHAATTHRGRRRPGRTARVITAAALIMVCVFSAFVLGDDRALKLFGLGLAVAVLIDATIVRMVLGAGDDGAARRPQLVAPEVARPDPAAGCTSRASTHRCRRTHRTKEASSSAPPATDPRLRDSPRFLRR